MLTRAGVVISVFFVFLSSVSFAQTKLEGDINLDKKVDYQDLMILIESWHEKTQADVTPTSTPTETQFVTPTPTLSPSPTPTSTTEEIITITLPGDVPLKMVKIPSGTFEMGRYTDEQDSNSYEDPQHSVNIEYDFYLGQTEVTKAQWEAVMGTTPWSGRSYVLEDPNSPAVYISWYDCQSFIEEINKLGQGEFKLPSEAEWEYSSRAGTTTRFYWGDDLNYTEINNFAWYEGNAGDVGEKYAHVVAQKLPNAWGLFDTSGNVFEWCQDWYHDNYRGAPTDGSAWNIISTNPVRVLRSAFWDNSAQNCRSAYRDYNTPSSYGNYIGFRLIREVP